jgi:hypothetical protein
MSKQLVTPNPDTVDGAGWCLRFTQSVWGAPARYDSAWEAWNATEYKHGTDQALPDVAVILWFSHYGTYGEPPTYGNWGHVVTYFPSRGFLSSPGKGYGQEWFDSPGGVETKFNAKYVGWSEDINGLRVAEIGDDMNDEQNNALMSVYKATFFGGGDAGEKSIIQRLTDIENKVDGGSAGGGLSEADVLRIIKSVKYKAE